MPPKSAERPQQEQFEAPPESGERAKESGLELMSNAEAVEELSRHAKEAESRGKEERKELDLTKKTLESAAQRYGVELDAEAINDNAEIDTEADAAGKRFKETLKDIMSMQDQVAEVQQTADKEATIEGSLMSMQDQMEYVQRVADAAPRPLKKPPAPKKPDRLPSTAAPEVAEGDILESAPAAPTAEAKPDAAAADAARLAELSAQEQKLMADYDALAKQVATEAQFMTPDDAKAYKKALKSGDMSALPKATPAETAMNDAFKRLNSLRAEKNALRAGQKPAEARAASAPAAEKRELSPTDKMLSDLAPEVAAAAKRNYETVDEKSNGGLIAKQLTPEGTVRATYADNTVLELRPDGSYSASKLRSPEQPKAAAAPAAPEYAPSPEQFDDAANIENGDLLTLESDRTADQKALAELSAKNDAVSVTQREQLQKRLDLMNAAIDRKRTPDGLTKEIAKLQDRIDSAMAKMVNLPEDQEAMYLRSIENLMSQVTELKKRREQAPQKPDDRTEPAAASAAPEAPEPHDDAEPMMLEDDPRYRELFDKKVRQLKAKGVDDKQSALEAAEFAQTMFKKRFPDEAATYEERRNQKAA